MYENENRSCKESKYKLSSLNMQITDALVTIFLLVHNILRGIEPSCFSRQKTSVLFQLINVDQEMNTIHGGNYFQRFRLMKFEATFNV